MREWSGVLVLAETLGRGVHPVSYELLGKGRELADALACGLGCLLLSDGADARELGYRGADTVYTITDAAFAKPEEVLYKSNIVGFIREYKPAIVLAGATAFGRSLAPRVAAALGAGLTADCTELAIGKDGELIQIRPAFSGNILAHITSRTQPQMATVRYGEFAAPARDTGRQAEVLCLDPYLTEYDGTAVTLTARRAPDLTEAEVIVAAGRGLRTAEDISLVRKLAERMGGRVGFSRALVDAGIADADLQIGYSGLRVKPRLYIACGISGAPQHLAGMKDSETVIAINRDASAPIFNVCDIGCVGDLYEIIPRLIDEFTVRGAVL